ncbi:hypothetical protein CROQUDRAFT_88733 [Cronartium quercuum f. sp. fusiforme G11]|uniref:Uncharacterized protein n=1 Tax=Cronartium quercuum f. sp. fusiforme G11 TaxID=708437 RepID=A0A9P6NTE2_9BASI|nr:hypothetical protein CROQUDRAFT_88733 [Cronartium quercuum f. sp. fusiforme G11]
MITLLQAVLARLSSSPSISEIPLLFGPHTPTFTHSKSPHLLASSLPESLIKNSALTHPHEPLKPITLISSDWTSFTPAHINFTHPSPVSLSLALPMPLLLISSTKCGPNAHQYDLESHHTSLERHQPSESACLDPTKRIPSLS